ncbi:MAG: glycoside hydrolase family 27 protein [Actinomycetota bacterium]
MRSRIAILITAAAMVFPVASPAASHALDDGLAQTPPMGWNPWNAFGCDITEDLIRETADAMAEKLQGAGYEYLVLDDCWMAPARGADGNLLPDPIRFSHGIKALADYVHGLGLKIGIYQDAGLLTCQRLPGSYGFYEQDAKTFAAWGIDYLKFDWCFANVDNIPYACSAVGLSIQTCLEVWPKGLGAGFNQATAYAMMRDAIAAAGRPMVFSICSWGSGDPWLWGKNTGHLWRTTPDIEANWESIVGIIDQNADLAPYAGPGGWNDPDMLEVGVGSVTPVEGRAHFSMWAMMAAPLMAGNDLRTMPDETLNILTNTEVIAVDQDPLGEQGVRILDDGDHEVWRKRLADGGRAVVLLNRGAAAAEMSVTAAQLGLGPAASYHVHDLWAGTASGVEGAITVTVEPHGAAMFRVNAA